MNRDVESNNPKKMQKPKAILDRRSASRRAARADTESVFSPNSNHCCLQPMSIAERIAVSASTRSSNKAWNLVLTLQYETAIQYKRGDVPTYRENQTSVQRRRAAIVHSDVGSQVSQFRPACICQLGCRYTVANPQAVWIASSIRSNRHFLNEIRQGSTDSITSIPCIAATTAQQAA